MRTGVIYARFSTDLQKDASIDDQERLCRELAQRENIAVARVYADRAQSGTSMFHRTELLALLQDAQSGKFDVVICEGIDRLSRNQADIANIHQNLDFDGVEILTGSEGWVSELHIGLKGTMSALFVKDLSAKVKRGQEGRLIAGKCPAGLCYGYSLGNGPGERVIHPEQAKTVRWIYDQYIAGHSPRTIAARLNARRIPSPKGGEWVQSAINGNRKRASGILENPIYAGKRLHNRQTFVRNPRTGRTVARLQPRKNWIEAEVPELAIVTAEQWTAVRARKAGNASRPARRVTYLLSGLMACGSCGGSYVSAGGGRFRCSHHKDRGTCTNNKRAYIEDVQSRVLAALKQHLSNPAWIQIFIDEYHRHWRALNADTQTDEQDLMRRKTATESKIAGLIRVAETGVVSAALAAQLTARESELADIQNELAQLTTTPPVLIADNLAQKWADSLADIQGLLQSDKIAPAREILKTLIETITIYPTKTGVNLEIGGYVGRGRGT